MAVVLAAGATALGVAAYASYTSYTSDPDYLLVTAMGGFSEGDMREAYEKARRKEREEGVLRKERENVEKAEEIERQRIKVRHAAIQFNKVRAEQSIKAKTQNHMRRMKTRHLMMQNHARMMGVIEDARIAAHEELEREMTKLVAQKKSLRAKAKMVGRPAKSCKRLYRTHRSVLRRIEQVRESIESIV